MCGRYELNETPARLGSRYRVEPGEIEFAANVDVSPTSVNPVVLVHDGARQLSLRRWGLVPSWVRDPKAVRHPFNAASETAADKPFFRTALRKRRCVVPVNAFFEWMPVAGEKRKRKMRIARADGQIMSLAGLYEYWRQGDERIASYTILTTQPNAIMEPIHDRMPVVIADDEVDAWLDADTPIDSVRALCMRCPSEWLEAGIALS
ncbi:MAG: SOS response-associated peptidase [Betaproteobacteria bacterium]